jgi:hypothetical protein
MPFKLGLMMMVFSLFSTVQAAEKDSLPLDLIELLGELDDDNQDSFDEDSLDAAMSDIQTPVLSSKQQQKIEVGGQK